MTRMLVTRNITVLWQVQAAAAAVHMAKIKCSCPASRQLTILQWQQTAAALALPVLDFKLHTAKTAAATAAAGASAVPCRIGQAADAHTSEERMATNIQLLTAAAAAVEATLQLQAEQHPTGQMRCYQGQETSLEVTEDHVMQVLLVAGLGVELGLEAAAAEAAAEGVILHAEQHHCSSSSSGTALLLLQVGLLLATRGLLVPLVLLLAEEITV
jgi:hypothetical protein